MNIKEQLADAKKELASLKEGIKAQNDDAMSRANELLNDVIPNLEAKAKKSDEAKSILSSIGNSTEKEKNMETPKSLGEFCAKEFETAEKGQYVAKIADYAPGLKTDPTTISGVPQLLDYDKRPVNILKPLKIYDLFAHESITGNALTFYTVEDLNGGAGTTAEGAKKNQIDFKYTPKTLPLTKVTAFLKESEEIILDSPWLASAINDRLINKLLLAEEQQLLNGNGTSPNMTGLLNTTGVERMDYVTNLDADIIFEATMKIKKDSQLDADAIVINPTDYFGLRVAKDGNNQYFGGGYFMNPYGNGGISPYPDLWGLKTVITTAVAAGTVVVGAFKQGGSVIEKNGLRVEMTNTNEDDFVKNCVTLRAEKREVLAVRVPQAFKAIKKQGTTNKKSK